MKSLFTTVAFLLCLAGFTAQAQNYSGIQTLQLTANSSQEVSFAANTNRFPWAVIINAGNSTVNYRIGSGNTIALNTDPTIGPNACAILAIGSASNVAALSSQAGSVRVLQADSQPLNLTCTNPNPPAPPAAGSGVDRSANPISLSGLNLILTIPLPATTRKEVEVMAACAAGVFVVVDDGTDTPPACTAVKCSVFPLTGGTADGKQGGEWTSSSHQGRVRVYSTNASCSVVAHEW